MLGILFMVMVILLFMATAGYAVFVIQEMTAKAPFVPVPKEALRDIISALRLKKGSVLYDLGSGDGRVIAMAAAMHPDIRGIGIERSFLAHILARKKRSKGTVFLRKDFFSVPLHDATHVFLYLFPELMDDLYPKLQRELRPGTRVVSCDFPFSKKDSSEIIYLNEKRNRARKLLVYEF